MKKVLWIGEIAPSNEVAKSKATSAAASVWQLGFIDGLIENKVDVTVFSYATYSTWPKGPLWGSKPLNKINKKGVIQYYFGYLNIYFVREFWIAMSIIFFYLVNKNLQCENFAVFTYNPLKRHKISALFLRFIYKIKWFSIVADGVASGNPDITIFLSYAYFKRFNKGKKYFLDGGINKVEQNCHCLPNVKRILLYAGTQTKLTGLIDFVKLFEYFKDERYELHIYGKGENTTLKRLSMKDQRIKLKGFVPDNILNTACCSAYAFINPRLNNIVANRTFPSKLLFYLRYNKPIISTKTQSLSPKYDQLIFKIDLNKKNSLEKCFSSIEHVDLKLYSKLVQDFKRENSWYKLVKKFLENVIN